MKALYWCDGRRTLAEVIRLTRLEVGSTNFDLLKYFRFLERKGYVEFVRDKRRTKQTAETLRRQIQTQISAPVGMTQMRKLDAIKMFLNVIPANAGIQTVLQER